jgi:hypothetical protein
VTTIRALTAADLPAVCSLFEQVARSGGPEPPDALVKYFELTFLANPWADDDMPSLVQEDRDGNLVGFIGSQVRRIRVDGRAARVVFSGPLVAAPGSPGTGALLTRRLLAGPQEMTLSDGATDYMRRIWEGLGGYTAVAPSVTWAKIFRPAGFARYVAERGGRRGLGRTLRVLGPGLDTVGRGLMRRIPRMIPRRPDVTVEPLTADGLAAQLRSAGRRLRLYPDYDEAYLEWLFDILHVVRGTPYRHLVLNGAGTPLGWYVYYLADSGLAHVLQVAATTSGRVADVLDHMLWHADAQGARAALGRLEPATFGELAPRRCLLVQTGLYSLVHTENSAIAGLLATPKALLSTLDSGVWMGHNTLFSDQRRHPSP